MYRYLERLLAQHIRDFLRRTYNVELERIVIEQPPNVQFGEYALPLAFELAKKLRKAPRKIAEEIAAGIGAVEGFEKFEVAGAGYINARVNRAALSLAVAKGEEQETEAFFARLYYYDVTPRIARRAGRLRFEWRRVGQSLSLADATIAAVALENKLTLFTDNLKTFPMPELVIHPLPA